MRARGARPSAGGAASAGAGPVPARERRVGGGGGGADLLCGSADLICGEAVLSAVLGAGGGAALTCGEVVLSVMLAAAGDASGCELLDAAVLLRGRVSALALVLRSWLLRRARGGAGAAFFGEAGVGCDEALVGDFGSEGGGLWSSDDVRGGGGGSGLFRSVGVRERLLGEVGLVIVIGKVDVLSDIKVGEKSSNATVCGPFGVTALPCRGFGGGGFFFSSLPPLVINFALSSSSDTESSYEVRGVSPCGSCNVSKSDCRDSEDVSVLLLLSP